MVRRKLLYIGLFLLLLLSLVAPLTLPTPALADTSTTYSWTSDGFLRGSNQGSYATARNAATADSVRATDVYVKVGQENQYIGPTSDDYFYVYRGYIYFITSGIPDDATITSATLYLYGYGLYDERAFNLIVTEGMPTYPHDPLVAGDYNLANYDTTTLASISSASWTTTGYNALVLNADGLAEISKTGTTKFCLRSSQDIGNSAPATGDSEYILFYAREKGVTYAPKLVVVYSLPTETPEVSTSEADVIGETTARLRGQLTEDGGELCTVWFQYGLTDSYGSQTPIQDGFVEGSTFADVITGLNRGDLYHFRAVTANSEGVDYGDDATFITLPAIPSNLVAVAGDAQVSLTWTKGNGAQKTMIRYRTDGSYPQSPTDGTQAYFDTGSSYPHTSLDNDTTYTYSAWSYATEGGESAYSSSYDVAFATPRADAPPTIVTLATTDITQSTATLHGHLTGMGGYGTVAVKFQYHADGGSWGDSETTPEDLTSVGYFEFDISSLSSDTLYHVRVVGTSGGGTTNGSDVPFTTGAISAPTMLTQAATGVTMDSATLHGKVSSDGGASVTAWFEWGLDINYGQSSSTASGLTTDSTLYFNLGSLEPSTTYHFRIVGQNSEGIGYGDDTTFATSSPSLPSVTTQAASSIGADSARLNGLLASDGGETCEVQFQWYAEDEAQWAHSTGWQPDKASSDTFNAFIADLDIGKTYYFRAQAKNSGGTSSGGSMTFITIFGAPADFHATAVASDAIELTWTLRGEQTYIVMKPTGYPSDRADGELTYFGGGNEYIQMGLVPGETYYYRAWSWTTAGNFSVGYSDTLATTLAPGVGEQEPPDIIISPDQPSRWFTAPDPTQLDGLFFYEPINNLADAIEMPHGTFWLLLFTVGAVILGFLAHLAVKDNPMPAVIVAGLVLMSGWWMFIIPLWMIAVYLIVSTGILYLERRF